MNRTYEVLLVEDNDDDAVLTIGAFKQSGYPVNVTRVENGLECLKLLKHRCESHDECLPDLILLDQNMPLMSGREVLEVISDNELLNAIPVVVLSTSCSEEEVTQMYRLKCRQYLAKPVDLIKFRRDITALSHYWFSLVTLPQRSKPTLK